jgi:ABC-2 type transport system ATP-binding protein
MNSDLVIETEGLSKTYGGRVAVDGLSIEVPAGVVCGFVGPNGAGKTTTMAMLLGLVARSGGAGRVLGESIDDPGAYLGQVGALIEGPAFYGGMSANENLRVLATAGKHDPARIPRLLELVRLSDRADDRFGSYSLGMKQRLGIAAALLGDPALVILDEPANGLDPAGIHEMRQLIRTLADGGRTIFVSSHVLPELQHVCDWFVVIDRGRVLFQGPASELLDTGDTRLIVATERVSDLPELRQLVAARGFDAAVSEAALTVRPNGTDPRHVAAEVSRTAAAGGMALVELRIERTDLEEKYLSMVKGGDGA